MLFNPETVTRVFMSIKVSGNEFEDDAKLKVLQSKLL
jgi:hypothetical protein